MTAPDEVGREPGKGSRRHSAPNTTRRHFDWPVPGIAGSAPRKRHTGKTGKNSIIAPSPSCSTPLPSASRPPLPLPRPLDSQFPLGHLTLGVLFSRGRRESGPLQLVEPCDKSFVCPGRDRVWFPASLAAVPMLLGVPVIPLPPLGSDRSLESKRPTRTTTPQPSDTPWTYIVALRMHPQSPRRLELHNDAAIHFYQQGDTRTRLTCSLPTLRPPTRHLECADGHCCCSVDGGLEQGRGDSGRVPAAWTLAEMREQRGLSDGPALPRSPG